MRIYKNCKEAASETKRELKEMGVEIHGQTMQDKNIVDDPDYYTNELLAYSYMIVDPTDKKELLKAFGKENEEGWDIVEFKERIGQEKLNPGEAYKLRMKTWSEFMHDGKFSYTYSERIGDQVEKVIAELKEHPASRNAIIGMWNPDIDIDRIGGKMRVPCTMFYQPIIRDGKLNMVYVIRSNDLMTHWCHDIYLAISLQEYIAKELGIETGAFYQFVTSLHGYHKDIKGIF